MSPHSPSRLVPDQGWPKPARSAEERERLRQQLEAQHFLAEHGDEVPRDVMERLAPLLERAE